MKLTSTGPMGHFFKLALVYSYLLCFISAGAFGQDKGDDVKLSVKGANITLAQAFLQIKKQTGLTVFYNNQLLNDKEKVSVDLKNTSLGTVLNTLLKGKNIGYEIRRDKVIVLNNKPAPAIPANKQESTYLLKGKVADSETNETLIGVSIVVKGEKNGMAVTDRNGNFSIRVSKSDVLTFMYVGYTPIDVPVANINNDPIKLKPSTSALDEVVIIGYGEVKRGDLTGAVGQVKIKDLQKAPVATFDQALAGRVAGVQVTSNEDQPGNGMNIVIRGGNSLTQSNSPLYVIDGFPMEEANTFSINPKDIKSITILKDASSTAIYGSRGANGVVVVETFEGQVGKTKFDYETSYGYQEVIKRMELMSPYEFIKYQAEFDKEYADEVYLNNGRNLEDYRNAIGIDWQDQLFRKGKFYNHSLSVSGGKDKTKFLISGSLLGQDGAIINSGFKRHQGRINFTHSASNKLDINFQANYAGDKSFGDFASTGTSTTQPYASFLLYRVWGYRPITGVGDLNLLESLMDPDGNDARFNPILDYKNSENVRSNDNINLTGTATYKFSKNLSLKIRGGFNSRNLKQTSFYNSNTSRGSSLSSANTKGVNGTALNATYKNWVNENTLTYKNRFGKNHNFTGLLGWTLQGDRVENYQLSGEQVTMESLGISGLDTGIPGANSVSHTDNSLMSYLARADYNFKSRYLATVSVRSDGSSKFIRQNRWSYFPSVALAWKVTEESFMKKIRAISETKFRVSYGLTGNNRIDNFARFAQLTMPYGAYYSLNNATPTPGIFISTFGNENLKWETTGQLDAGIDLSLFKNRINLTVDYYNKKTTDLLLRSNVPYTTGYTTIYKNVGSVRNTGWEFSLSTENIRGKSFQWSTDFNISFNKNKILSLSENESSLLSTVNWAAFGSVNGYIAEVGKPAGMFYGLIWDGVYAVDDFTWNNNSDSSIPHENRAYVLKSNMPTNGSTRTSIRPGDVKYRDVNNDGVVNIQDNVVIGRGLPIHTGGFNNNFSYKSFSLNVFFQWSYGNQVMNGNRVYLEGNDASRSALNQFATYQDRWTFENQQSTLFRTKGQGPTNIYSTRTLEDGSFLRLKTVSFAYSLPKSLINMVNVKSFDLFASAQNLFTWTKYSGMDPEVSTRNTALTPGLDYSSYPRSRTLTFGFRTSL